MKTIELITKVLTAQFPEDLVKMPEDMKDLYYPYDQCPEQIWMDDNGTAQITFQRIEKTLLLSEVASAIEAIHNYTEKLYPQEAFFPVHLYREGEILVGWFVMKQEMAGEWQKHAKAVFSVANRMCMLTLTYPEREHIKWEVILKQILKSLHERENDETNT